MPRIRDNIRDCAVYLYSSKATAESGSEAIGSGFLLGIPSNTDLNWCHAYAVANRSAVAKGATFVRLNTKAGATDIIELAPDDWLFHPQGDDLAVAHLTLPSDYHNYMLVNDPEMFLIREWMDAARIGLGDDVFTVGRLIDAEGRQHNSPAVRFGQIAAMPREKLPMAGGQSQECFLIDGRSLGGLAGSPVFVTVHHLRLPNPVEFNHAWFPHLLGVNCGQITNDGLMMVLPAWRLAELLNHSRFLQARSREDARRKLAGK